MRALVYVTATVVISIALWRATSTDRYSYSYDQRDGILLTAGVAGQGPDGSVRVIVDVDGHVLRDQSDIHRGESAFVPVSFPSKGWLRIRRLDPSAAHLKEECYLFPLSDEDGHGQWRVELGAIAHVFKYGIFDTHAHRRSLVAKVEPPGYGIMATNNSDLEVKRLSIHHPSGDLVAENLPPDWDRFVYWGVPMTGIEELGITIEMANGAETVTGFTGLSSADEDARWWPRRWEVVVLRGPSGAVFLKR